MKSFCVEVSAVNFATSGIWIVGLILFLSWCFEYSKHWVYCSNWMFVCACILKYLNVRINSHISVIESSREKTCRCSAIWETFRIRSTRVQPELATVFFERQENLHINWIESSVNCVNVTYFLPCVILYPNPMFSKNHSINFSTSIY